MIKKFSLDWFQSSGMQLALNDFNGFIHVKDNKGGHGAYSRFCPNWIGKIEKIKKCLTIRITQKLYYPEACKLIESNNPFIRISHSNLLKQPWKSVRIISAQTPSLADNFGKWCE